MATPIQYVEIIARTLHNRVVHYNETDDPQDQVNAGVLLDMTSRIAEALYEFDARFDPDKFIEIVLNGEQ